MEKNKKENPYSLMFGKEPQQMISRIAQKEEVIDSFLAEIPSQMVYMITGVRGSGKTVFMTDIQNRLKKEKDWIVVQLNPQRDLLSGLLSKLCDDSTLMKMLKSAKINLSFFGVGLTVNSSNSPITDVEVALSRVIEQVKKQGKRILVAIDEVSNNENVRIFAAAYQILIQQDLPVYLSMTGLYDNIYNLQNEKTLTFLYRAPKIHLLSLNTGSMSASYRRSLGVSEEDARTMAQLTKGYAFAFQVLGYYTYLSDGNFLSSIGQVRLYLEEYVYEKIWSELSAKDREILYLLANHPSGKVMELREMLNLKPNEFGPYRDRLIRKGLIDGSVRGQISFALPFFSEYVLDKMNQM